MDRQREGQTDGDRSQGQKKIRKMEEIDIKQAKKKISRKDVSNVRLQRKKQERTQNRFLDTDV